MQKMLKKASEKLVFKCGIVHHKVGSSCHNTISNMNYTGHAEKMSSLPAKREGQRFAHKSATLKKKLFTDNREQSFAPPNFKSKFNFSDFKKRADDKPKQKSGSIPKSNYVSKTVLNNTPKQYVQNGIRVNDNSPSGASASRSYALVEASNNQNNGILYFRTVLDTTKSRLEGKCQEWLHIQSSVYDLPPEANELISTKTTCVPHLRALVWCAYSRQLIFYFCLSAVTTNEHG